MKNYLMVVIYKLQYTDQKNLLLIIKRKLKHLIIESISLRLQPLQQTKDALLSFPL